jgi:hypothetical protein
LGVERLFHFERGFDPAKRAQLGAHFTGREDIELVVACDRDVLYPCFWISFASQSSAVSAVFAGGIELDGVLAA